MRRWEWPCTIGSCGDSWWRRRGTWIQGSIREHGATDLRICSDAAPLLSHQLWRTHTDHTSAMAGVIWFHVKLFVLLHPSNSTNDAVLRPFWNLEKTISRFQFRSFCAISVISSLSRKIPMYLLILAASYSAPSLSVPHIFSTSLCCVGWTLLWTPTRRPESS